MYRYVASILDNVWRHGSPMIKFASSIIPPGLRPNAPEELPSGRRHPPHALPRKAQQTFDLLDFLL
jgi:hypothetical protein